MIGGIEVDLEEVLNSLADGLYITDLERRIIFWNAAAEKITGWPAEHVLGRQCLDGILCHRDKDGHRLCGEATCPLYRSMVTGLRSPQEIVVFATSAMGKEVPMRVTTAPLRNHLGEVVGGVETFRDITEEYRDLDRARRAQALVMAHPEIMNPKVAVSERYIPLGVMGGDFHAIAELDEQRIAFWLGDVMGHGITPGLHAVRLRCYWSEFANLMHDPVYLMATVNQRLTLAPDPDGIFATAVFALLDTSTPSITLVSAGGPPPIIYTPDGQVEQKLDLSGVPLGVLPDASFGTTTVPLKPGSVLLFYTDGAVEFRIADGGRLGPSGLLRVLTDLGYPDPSVSLEDVEKALLIASQSVRLPDDLTLLEVRLLDEPEAAARHA